MFPHNNLTQQKRSKILNFDSPPSNSKSFKRLISRVNCQKTMESEPDSALLNTRQASADITQNTVTIFDENHQFSANSKFSGKSLLLSKVKSFDTNPTLMLPKAFSLSFEEARKGTFSADTSPFSLKNNKLFSEFSESHRELMDIENDMSQDLSFKDDIIMVEEAFHRTDSARMNNPFDFSSNIFMNEDDAANKQKNQVIESLTSLETEKKDESFSFDFKQGKEKGLKQMVDLKKAVSKLNSEFEVLETIGSGSFGKVLKCKSIVDSKIYAVKISNKKLKGASRDRAMNEENVLKTIASFEGETNIVKYYGSWTEDDKMCLLMEYCPMNLRDHMNSTPKFPEQEISYMLEQLARGLEFLHSHDIVHMDVKPENILVDQKNNLKLTDFGQSRIISPIFSGDFDDGDSRYMAPELLNLSSAETHGPQLKSADIFSLGMTIYELITRIEIPKRGATWKALRSGDFSALDEVHDISSSMKQIIKRMMDPDPKNRPSLSEIIKHNELTCKKNLEVSKNVSI